MGRDEILDKIQINTITTENGGEKDTMRNLIGNVNLTFRYLYRYIKERSSTQRGLA